MSHFTVSPLACQANRSLLKAMAWTFLMIAWASQCVHAGPSDAPNATPATVSAPAAGATDPSGTAYTVKKGDTLLGLVRSQYKGSPLRPEVLRDAVLAANPEWGKSKAQVPRPGTRLVLPEHGQILIQAVTAYVAPQDLSRLLPPTEVVDTTPRRDWVRFP